MKDLTNRERILLGIGATLMCLGIILFILGFTALLGIVPFGVGMMCFAIGMKDSFSKLFA